MSFKDRFFNIRYRNYFFNPTYWLRAIRKPHKAWQALNAAIRYPALYQISRSTEGLISLYLGTFLYETVLRTKCTSPNVVEVGAYKGLSTIYLSLAASQVDKRIKSFELFSGLPTTDPELDLSFTKSQFAADISEYETNVRRYGRWDVVDLIVGDARQFLTTELESSGFCIAFLDVDTYEVTRDLLFMLWPLASGGETIIVHDTWSPGVRKSIDEFHDLSQNTVIETEPEKGTTSCLIIPTNRVCAN